MNKNDDVLKQLEVKNREIYTNKLNIDLDNNNEILLITLDNIINLFQEEVKNKITELSSKSINKEELTAKIDTFYQKIKEEIQSLLNNRYIVLKDCITDIDNIDYQDNIDKEKDIVIKGIKSKYNNLVDKLIKEIERIYNEPNNRINDYLKILNYKKIVNKMEEILNNMNMILYNSYIESNNKFQELNAKTLNK